jgi:hypothetical protein
MCNKCEEEKIKIMERDYLNKNCELNEYLFNNLLDENCNWNNIKTYEKIKTIKSCLSVANKDEVQNFIYNELGYNVYLKTPLWKAVAEYKKYKINKCQLCNCKDKLNVHHSTYKNIGFEIFNLNDLIVLCQNCHYKYHNKENI